MIYLQKDGTIIAEAQEDIADMLTSVEVLI